MRVLTDDWSTAGRWHLSQGGISQDYSKSGVSKSGLFYSVVADGCSGANADTDIGSRVLIHAFVRTLNDAKAPSDISEKWFREVLLGNLYEMTFTDNPNDYLSTLVAVVSDGVETFTTFMGDGTCIVKREDGSLDEITIDFSNNMPLYPMYSNSDSMLQAYIDAQGVDKPMCKVSINGVESWKSYQDVSDGVVFPIQMDGVICVAVATDGIGQSKGNIGEPIGEAVVNFKTTEGQFVKRRMMRVSRELQKASGGWDDDISIGAILFDRSNTDDS